MRRLAEVKEGDGNKTDFSEAEKILAAYRNNNGIFGERGEYEQPKSTNGAMSGISWDTKKRARTCLDEWL